MAFQRTFLGKVNKARFVPEPIVYVEGPEDVAFLAPLRRRITVRIEAVNGKPEAKKLAYKLVEDGGGYGVLMDADFDGVLGTKITHPQVLYLSTYAIENLLADDNLIVSLVADHCACDDRAVSEVAKVTSFFGANGARFRRAVAIDLSSRLEDPPFEAMPGDIGRWVCPSLEIKAEMDADLALAEAKVSGAVSQRVESIFAGVEDLLVCLDYLRGHLIFGVIRACIFGAASHTGKKMRLDDRSLLRLLSERFWAVDSYRSTELFGQFGGLVAAIP